MPAWASVRRGRLWTLAAFVGLTAMGTAILMWSLMNQVADPPVPSVAQGSNLTQVESEASRVASTPLSKTRSARQVAAPERPARALRRSLPERIEIPAIKVSAAVHPLGLDGRGALQVPSGARYNDAAWYSGSPAPGQNGPAVIEGHVTSSGATPSVFFNLGKVKKGDVIKVARADGTTAVFAVYATSMFPKNAFPKVAVYGYTASPELRVITCGGQYNASQRSHVDNVVVFAKQKK